MKLLFLFVVAVIGIQAGMAVKCYLCDPCDDLDKSMWTEEECPEQCLRVRKTAWLVGRGVYSHKRLCAAKGATCEELFPPPFKYDRMIPDRVSPNFDCTFCDTPLCNV